MKKFASQDDKNYGLNLKSHDLCIKKEFSQEEQDRKSQLMESFLGRDDVFDDEADSVSNSSGSDDAFNANNRNEEDTSYLDDLLQSDIKLSCDFKEDESPSTK